jgi:hypothetical protein
MKPKKESYTDSWKIKDAIKIKIPPSPLKGWRGKCLKWFLKYSQ